MTADLDSSTLTAPQSPEHGRNLWRGVDAVVDRTDSLSDLRAHRLHLLAARRWRQLGRDVPAELVDDEFRAAWTYAATRALLRDACAAYDGALLILKGAHTASLYPAPQLRPFADVDLLADDPERAQRALVDAGFVAVGFEDEYYRGLHHLRPLLDPERQLVVEIHRFPNWFAWSEPPAREMMLGAAQMDVLGVDGLRGLSPAQHALVLAAHAWVELPFRRVLDLVDVAAVAETADPEEIAEIAERWDMERVWSTTQAAAEAMFYGGPVPTAMRVCAGNFMSVRDRTVQETHVRRLISGFWALPPLRAFAQLGSAAAQTVLPAPSDTWQTKLARGRLAIRHRAQPSAEHAELLGADGQRAPRFRRR